MLVLERLDHPQLDQTVLKIWCTRQSLIHIKKQGKFLQGKAMTVFDRVYEASVANLESVLQPGMDIAVFMFRYFIVKTKIDV